MSNVVIAKLVYKKDPNVQVSCRIEQLWVDGTCYRLYIGGHYSTYEKSLWDILIPEVSNYRPHYVECCPGRGKDIMAWLESFGGKNSHNLKGEDKSGFYFIKPDGAISIEHKNTLFGKWILEHGVQLFLPPVEPPQKKEVETEDKLQDIKRFVKSKAIEYNLLSVGSKRYEDMREYITLASFCHKLLDYITKLQKTEKK